jgi:hypothetical protein
MPDGSGSFSSGTDQDGGRYAWKTASGPDYPKEDWIDKTGITRILLHAPFHRALPVFGWTGVIGRGFINNPDE